MDKAPDAFRTISEVAEELDIPQHVLRFWETRFAQIKPMKRSGGRRYYRPDDVDLLQGHSSPAVRRGLHHPRRAADPEGARHQVGAGAVPTRLRPSASARSRRRSVSACRSPRRARPRPSMPTTRITRPKAPTTGSTSASSIPTRTASCCHRPRPNPGRRRSADRARLERVLQELIACRQLLDSAMKDG